VATAIAVNAAVVGPMTPLLADICGGEARGRFWSRLTSVLIVLSAMLLSHFPVNPQTIEDPTDPYIPFWIVVTQLKWALAGVIGSFIIVAIVIGISISGYEQRQAARAREAGRATPPSQVL
jgi:hypothetical protein